MDNVSTFTNGHAKGLASARDEGRTVVLNAMRDRSEHFDGSYWLKTAVVEIGRDYVTGEIMVRTAENNGVTTGSIDLAFFAGILWGAAELQSAIERNQEEEGSGDTGPPAVA
jgi:hypothetical protein